MAEAGGVLVIGADGTLGAAVATRLEGRGVPVIRTSRRRTAGSIPLDLAEPPTWGALPRVTAAVLCAAVTSTETCRDRPEDARRVNVDCTLALGRRLTAAGARIVFPSTNMVFDGSIPFTPAEAARCPQTAYGRLKAEAEVGLLALGRTTVVRLTKVIGGTLPVIERWRAALGRGEPIRPLADMVMAPVSIDHAAAVVAAACRESLGSVVQVSARADVSYAEVAARLVTGWSLPGSLVIPVTVAESGIHLEHVPRHTTLDASVVRDRLHLEPPDPWAALGEVA